MYTSIVLKNLPEHSMVLHNFLKQDMPLSFLISKTSHLILIYLVTKIVILQFCFAFTYSNFIVKNAFEKAQLWKQT